MYRMLSGLRPSIPCKVAIICNWVSENSRNPLMKLNRDIRNVCVGLINKPDGSGRILSSRETENILEMEHRPREEGGQTVKLDQIKKI